MKAKRRLIVVTTLSLVASVAGILSFSFAWFNHSKTWTNIITFNAGESVARLEAYVYRQNPANANAPIEVAYYKDETVKLNAALDQNSSTAGSFKIDFSDSIFADLDLLSTYNDEHSLNYLAFPAYYFEIRIIKENFYAYLTTKLSYVSVPTAGAGELDYSTTYPFDFKYLKVVNDSTNKYISAIPSQLSNLTARPKTDFFSTSLQRTNGITLFTLDDLDGAPIDTATPGLAPQTYIEGFPYYDVNDNGIFSQSLLMELRLDALEFVNYLRTTPAAHNQVIRFGINFTIDVVYSNDPIFVS